MVHLPTQLWYIYLWYINLWYIFQKQGMAHLPMVHLPHTILDIVTSQNDTMTGMDVQHRHFLRHLRGTEILVWEPSEI